MTIQQAPTITHLSGRDAGTSYDIGPERVTIRVPSSQTDAKYIVIEVLTPAGGGPPLHTHASAEIFTVLEGDFAFPTVVDGADHVVHASAGESVHIPAGIPHTYHNVGSTHGRLLGVLSPGIDMEGFFTSLGDITAPDAPPPTLDTPMDFPRVMAACEQFQVRFILPDMPGAPVGE